ncbi:SIR2 family protein [Pectobacterium brasiliense]|uniref:SIR2 family protein n=1 Tax=Pectobacterium brasiliense TaxID=180957 RepID=UPI000A7157DE|nr:SIR2 family protein [Pectobacterium brasiliense]
MKTNYLSFPEKHLKDILQSSLDNKLVFFIGAGFSKLSETDLTKTPSWDELIDELKEDLNIPNESDPLKIAQLYFLKYGQHTYENKVKSSIKDLDPSSFHKKLFHLNPHHIITTNWDNLVEKTAKEMSLAYELVSSDTDLAQSNLDKKIIKMHGDFRQHNFIFKEDDYLQYSQNFPLIENYIKGIFSTNTIVFLGYSYNDFNLKQIVSWITSISKATPPKYLLQNSFDDAQAQYLKNHGVSLLAPLEKKLSYKDLYLNLFQNLETINSPDELIKKELLSVNETIKKIDDDLNFSLVEKKNKKEKLNEQLTNKITKILDNKISILSQYKVVSPEHICKKLSNCTIDYKSPIEITLVFDNNLLNNGYNEDIREINKIYIDNMLNINNKSYNLFLSILEKSPISKISLGKKTYDIKNIFNHNNNELLRKINFDYPKDSIEFQFNNKEYKKILENLICKVNKCLHEENYIMATIYMSNYDIIYNIVKEHTSLEIDEIYESAIEIISKLPSFDYKSKIIDFPRNVQKDLQELVQILELNDIYKAYYRFNIESKKYLNYAQQRNNGGLAYSVDEYNIRNKLYSHIYFILGNDIFIDEFIEVKNFFESTILGSLEHYLTDNKFHVNSLDIFIIIKYSDTKKIKEFSEKLIKEKKFLTICKLKKEEIVFIKQYLKNILHNIANLFNFQVKTPLQMTSIDRWLNNLLVIFGFVKWSPKELKIIIEKIVPLLEHRTTSIVIYESIRDFLSINFNLYEKSHPGILKIIDVMLTKIINSQFNGFDTQIIHLNILQHIYAISSNHNHSYQNATLLKAALVVLEGKSIEWKKFITTNLLLNLKNIGSDEVQYLVNSFVENNILLSPCITPSDYIERLILISNGYPLPDDFITSLSDFIDENIPENLSNLEMIKSGIESTLPEILKHLIDKNHLKEFNPLLKLFEEKMNAVRR